MRKTIFSVIIICYCCFSAVAQTSKFSQANGLRIHYLEWGKGKETVILLHSLTDTADIWKDFAQLLAQNYRVIAPDRRGVGKTEKPLSGYEINNLAKDVEGLIDSLKLEKVHLIGHSFGGNIAATIAATVPDKIDSLILIEGGFWKKRKPANIPECPPPIENDCLISNTIKQELNDYDGEKLYSGIIMPTLLILGIPPSLSNPELNAEEKESKRFFDEAVNHVTMVAKQKLKNGNQVLVKNAEHWVFVDQPKVTANHILGFYKRNERRFTK